MAALSDLDAPNDFGRMLTRYRVADTLRSQALLLQEVRNEIISSDPGKFPAMQGFIENYNSLVAD